MSRVFLERGAFRILSDPFLLERVVLRYTLGMKSVLPVSLVCLALCGAGCMPTLMSPHVATELKPDTNVETIAPQKGFGTLPTIPVPQSHVTVTLQKPLPTLPNAVAVLRIRPGTPNDIELINVVAALGLPGGAVGTNTKSHELSMSWQDGQGLDWSYTGTDRGLDFESQAAKTAPLTVSALPSNDELLSTANNFLDTRDVSLTNYRDGALSPDWNYWWTNEQKNGHCMDANAVRTVRNLSVSPASGGFPILSSGNCVAAEFPDRATVRYTAMADQQDIIEPNGSNVSGIELTIDASRKTVIAGSITLTADPDRSDYPTLPAARVSELILAGGLSGATGNITVTDYAIELLRVIDPRTSPRVTYLIPSLVAKGTRTKTDGTTDSFQIVVPLPAS